MSRRQHIEMVADIIRDEYRYALMDGERRVFDPVAINAEEGWSYDLRDSDREYTDATGCTRFDGVRLSDADLAQAMKLAGGSDRDEES